MDRMPWGFLFVWIISIIISRGQRVCDAPTPWVSLSTGCVRGVNSTTALGRRVFSFRGIPYAAPPVGNLRFRAPRPVSAWDGVLDAVEEPPACMQPNREQEFPIRYSEDCLYLNVFTPYLQPPQGRLLPVMVWIHGGMFYRGSGSTYQYGPDFFLSKEVVMVSVNYRLGIFGNLNMYTAGAQGNAASKDQVAALRWVQREINLFGGDPSRVTIFGGSSGGGHVGLLYQSPMSKGLFQGAISHSSAAICQWCYLPSTQFLGARLAEALGCAPLDAPAVVDCLRGVDGEKLATAQTMFEGFEDMAVPFVPTLEHALGEEVFLSDSPQALAASAASAPVPYLLGITNGEGLMDVNSPQDDPDQFLTLRKELVSNLPPLIRDTQGPQVLQTIARAVDDFYLDNGSSLNTTMYGFADFRTDRKFGYCVIKNAQVASTQAPVYLYYFTFEGEFQVKKHGSNLRNMSGVCHGEELGYFFFRNFTLPAQNNLSSFPRDVEMVENMITLWTNFATYGNPTPPDGDNLGLKWPTVNGSCTRHMVLGDTLQVVQGELLPERVAFWDTLYSTLLRSRKGSIWKTVGQNNRIPVVVFLLLLFTFIGLIFGLKAKRHQRYVLLR